MSFSPKTPIFMWQLLLSFVLAVNLVILPVLALGTSCSVPLGAGTADPTAPYWLETIEKRGTSAFNPSESYTVFRNVKSYGAVGDGLTDDTVAINKAMADGSRCGKDCGSSTVSPAVVYFPPGTYLVSSPIVAWYYTAIVGDPKNLPVLLADPSFVGIAVIDANPYIPSGYGAQWYTNQNNFFRSVRNMIIDLRQMPSTVSATGLHWQVSQATSLTNVIVEMSRENGNSHQGMFMENGSGGYMGDLIFRGGRYGIWIGNQQFTVRNLTIEDAQTGIFAAWNWGWTFQGLTIKNCITGIYITTGGTGDTQTVGAEVILDAEVSDTRTFIMTSAATRTTLAGSIVIDNARLVNVGAAVAEEAGFVILNGGDTTIEHWVQGNVYEGNSPTGTFKQGSLPPPSKPSPLLDQDGKMFGRTRPQYADYDVSQIISVKAQGAVGDGKTDDTAAIKKVFEEYAGCKIIFFDAGTYLVSSTITIPEGTKMVGEVWSEIMAYGPNFQDQTKPTPVIQVGHPCSEGVLEISDMLFTTRGPASSAIVVQWNIGQAAGQQGAAGSWDTHIRLAASVGSQLGDEKCSRDRPTVNPDCVAAFLGLHLTQSSSAYIEGMWVWLGDHDLDGGHGQITVFSGRGVLSESAGPVWLIGTGSEHHVLYQYNFAGASDHYIGLMQTETPYYQPVPAPPVPFALESQWHDPSTSQLPAAWAVTIQSSRNILIYGAGLYSFFQNYETACIQSTDCQKQILTVDSASSGVHILSLSTVGTVYQLSIDGDGLITSSQNGNGFAATLTSWQAAPERRFCNVYTEFVVLPTAGYGFP